MDVPTTSDQVDPIVDSLSTNTTTSPTTTRTTNFVPQSTEQTTLGMPHDIPPPVHRLHATDERPRPARRELSAAERGTKWLKEMLGIAPFERQLPPALPFDVQVDRLVRMRAWLIERWGPGVAGGNAVGPVLLLNTNSPGPLSRVVREAKAGPSLLTNMLRGPTSTTAPTVTTTAHPSSTDPTTSTDLIAFTTTVLSPTATVDWERRDPAWLWDDLRHLDNMSWADSEGSQ